MFTDEEISIVLDALKCDYRTWAVKKLRSLVIGIAGVLVSTVGTIAVFYGCDNLSSLLVVSVYITMFIAPATLVPAIAKASATFPKREKALSILELTRETELNNRSCLRA